MDAQFSGLDRAGGRHKTKRLDDLLGQIADQVSLSDAYAHTLESQDGQEGIDAFIDKRAPV